MYFVMYLRCTKQPRLNELIVHNALKCRKYSGFKLQGPTPPGVYRRPAFDTRRPQCPTGSSRWRWCATGCRRWLRSSPSPLASTPHERRFPQGCEDHCLPISETVLWGKGIFAVCNSKMVIFKQSIFACLLNSIFESDINMYILVLAMRQKNNAHGHAAGHA